MTFQELQLLIAKLENAKKILEQAGKTIDTSILAELKKIVTAWEAAKHNHTDNLKRMKRNGDKAPSSDELAQLHTYRTSQYMNALKTANKLPLASPLTSTDKPSQILETLESEHTELDLPADIKSALRRTKKNISDGLSELASEQFDSIVDTGIALKDAAEEADQTPEDFYQNVQSGKNTLANVANLPAQMTAYKSITEAYEEVSGEEYKPQDKLLGKFGAFKRSLLKGGWPGFIVSFVKAIDPEFAKATTSYQAATKQATARAYIPAIPTVGVTSPVQPEPRPRSLTM